MKKSFYFIIVLMFLNSGIYAQRIVEKTAKVSSLQEIDLEFDFAEKISIKSWDKNEVYIKASVNINENKNNDAFSMEIKEYSSKVLVESDIKDLDKLSKENNCLEMDLFFEVTIPKNTNLKVETISGDIEIIGTNGELDIKSISGFIDLSLPQSYKADIELGTIAGSMYTNFNFDPGNHSGGLNQIGGGKIEESLNGGGKNIELETISGDIYLRKK